MVCAFPQPLMLDGTHHILLPAALVKEHPLHPVVSVISDGEGTFPERQELLKERGYDLSVCHSPSTNTVPGT